MEYAKAASFGLRFAAAYYLYKHEHEHLFIYLGLYYPIITNKMYYIYLGSTMKQCEIVEYRVRPASTIFYVEYPWNYTFVPGG